MGHLVQERVGAPFVHPISDARAKQQLFGDHHAAHVLDGAVELGDENLVVLGERILGSEQLGKEVQAALGEVEELPCVQVFGEGGSSGQGERNDLSRRAGVRVAKYLVLAGDDRSEVGRDGRRRRKVPHRDAVAHRSRCGRRLVREDRPVLGSGDVQGVGGFQVRLFKVRVDPSRVGGLERGVHVDLPVRGVHGAVHRRAVVRVDAVGRDPHDVVLQESRELDSTIRPRGGGIQRGAVDDDLVHMARDQIKVG